MKIENGLTKLKQGSLLEQWAARKIEDIEYRRKADMKEMNRLRSIINDLEDEIKELKRNKL